MAIIDERLIAQYRELYERKCYGQTAQELALEVQCCLLDLKPKVILEYGSGHSKLVDRLEIGESRWVHYDPAIPAISSVPIRSADLIINTDVMEHIPEHDVDDVLAHHRELSPFVFFHITTRAASKVLPNGENAHCTVWTPAAWLDAIKKFYPDANLVYTIADSSCFILTWRSPVASVICRVLKLRSLIRQHSLVESE